MESCLIPPNPELPVIMVTAHASNDEFQQRTNNLPVQAVLDNL
jgi:hypothetical protein